MSRVCAVPLGCSAELHFLVGNTTASGLSVRDLRLVGESYKFFRGARSFLRSGKFIMRL
jgi:hypothetical protein